MSEIKVNKLSSRTGNAVTLGTSGDTFTIPSGVTLTNSGTATGFGSDSDISWQSIVTSDTTMVAGRGYFVDSSGGTKTMTLPASPSIGDAVSVVALDGATNAVTIARNSSNIVGGTTNVLLSSDYASIQLVFTDASNGWVKVNNDVPDSFVDATGGTVTTSGDFKIHTFNSTSNFVVANTATTPANNEVSYLVVAGGGGGGKDRAGGGGAGGFREAESSADSYTQSPLAASTGLTISSTTYPITVGGGGSGGTTSPNVNGTNGSNSVFSTITSTGGGGGHTSNKTPHTGNPGGSGGGGGGSVSGTAGSGNTPPVSPSQGNPGGAGQDGSNSRGAGGGGAGAAAANASTSPSSATPGGAGVSTAISGSSSSYAGGGGSTGNPPITTATGGSGGGGNGGNPAGTAGSANTGGGGGGSHSSTGGAGGSGVVIIRYKYQ